MSWLEKRKVLVPFDFSETSSAAVETAVELAGGASAVTVLHVLEPMPAYDIAARYVDDIDEQHATKVRESLDQHFADPKYAGINLETIVGDPPHGIADYSETNGIGLIVISSHGRTGIKRLLMGSVAERVVRLAHCPVLVLKETGSDD